MNKYYDVIFTAYNDCDPRITLVIHCQFEGVSELDVFNKILNYCPCCNLILLDVGSIHEALDNGGN